TASSGSGCRWGSGGSDARGHRRRRCGRHCCRPANAPPCRRSRRAGRRPCPFPRRPTGLRPGWSRSWRRQAYRAYPRTVNRSLPFLGVAVLGLGAALLIPVAFSDPNGVDPYAVRLSATSLLVLGAAFASARLAAARPLLLTLAAITTTYTVLTAATAGGAPLSQVLWASLGQAALTIGFAVAVVRFAGAGTRPWLRLHSGVLTPLLVSSAGIVL